MRFVILLLTLCGLLPLPTRGQNGVSTSVSASHLRLRVQIRHVWNGVPLRLNDLRLVNRAGNHLEVSRLAYLVSDVSLRREDGTSVALSNQYGYVNAANGRSGFELAAVPAGRYVGLSFHIGLSPTVNHADPARFPAGHPLNPLVNRLHWGWQGGYVFAALEGHYIRPDGSRGGYSYHIARDANRMTVNVEKPFTLATDTALTLQCDVARFFDAMETVAIQAKNGGESTHSAPNDSLATRLKSNIEQAFTLTGAQTDSTRATEVTRPTLPTKQPVGSHYKPATPYTLAIPARFPQTTLPADNPLTVEGIALGKRLFFEKRLSGNNSQSCASCHAPERAFSSGKALSLGIDGKTGTRRAMPLFNLAWSPEYTWDGRRVRLRNQVLAPIQDAREMHETLPRVLRKLRATREYPRLFARAFGDEAITPTRLSLAVEQYLLTLVAADSKFDRALRHEATFTDEEKRGLLLFVTEYDPAHGKVGADCFHCHGGNLFTDYQYKNNGLDPTFRDVGRYAVTHQTADRGKFKTPSLRNVELIGPYMHDGRFKTLEAVIDHYTQRVHRSDTLDPNIAKHPDEGLALSSEDKRALVAFLKTLTDVRFHAGPKRVQSSPQGNGKRRNVRRPRDG